MMLLSHRFPDLQLNLMLELFLRTIRDSFEERLASVILHGSVVFDDLPLAMVTLTLWPW